MFASSFRFLFGLGVTQIVDAFGERLAQRFGPALHVIAIGIDLMVIGLLVGAYFIARSGRAWIFYVAGVLYILDALVLIPFQMALAIEFHAWVLFSWWNGLQGLKATRVLEAPPTANPGF